MSIEKFLARTKELTLLDLGNGHSKDYLLRNTMEELGEYCAARTVETGVKSKVLKESSKEEAVDVIICALSLLYAEGGEDDFLAAYGLQKLEKWAGRIK